MVIYLDNQSNRTGAPNENFARELLELFTLGEGHYSETDLKEAARAFTGWRVDRREGQDGVHDEADRQQRRDRHQEASRHEPSHRSLASYPRNESGAVEIIHGATQHYVLATRLLAPVRDVVER